MDEQIKAWRHIDANLFQFATTDLHELRAAIMLVFDEAATLAPSLGFDDVLAGLRGQGWDEPLDEARLHGSLKALVDWGLLDATQNHAARYATPEEFERKNIQWSLNPRGQAAIAGYLRAFEVLRSAISLQPAVLDAIADGLAELARLVQRSTDDGRIATQLAAVEQHHEALVHSVRQFNGELQRLLREDATSDDVFLDVKRRTITYLEEYVRDVERPARRVARSVENLQRVSVDKLFCRALAGANLAPAAGRNPADDWLAERRRRYAALQTWFAPASGQPPRIRTLRQFAESAILQLLRVLERRWESRRRAASVARDFRVLARAFAALDTETDAHRLFHAAFGLWPSRHAHLVEDEHETPRDTSFADAPAVVVAPALRRSGTQQHAGRPKRVRDPSELRAERQRHQAAELHRRAQVRRDLLTGDARPLSDFGELSRSAFSELLALLSVVLSAPPDARGARRARSSDGQVEIVLLPPRSGSAPAALATADGILEAPNYRVQIVPVGAGIQVARRAVEAETREDAIGSRR